MRYEGTKFHRMDRRDAVANIFMLRSNSRSSSGCWKTLSFRKLFCLLRATPPGREAFAPLRTAAAARYFAADDGTASLAAKVRARLFQRDSQRLRPSEIAIADATKAFGVNRAYVAGNGLFSQARSCWLPGSPRSSASIPATSRHNGRWFSFTRTCT